MLVVVHSLIEEPKKTKKVVTPKAR